MAVPIPLCTSPALMMVLLPLSVRMPEPFWLMMLPPARFWIVATKLDPAVLENTASEPLPLALIVPLLINWSLLPCR